MFQDCYRAGDVEYPDRMICFAVSWGELLVNNRGWGDAIHRR